MSENSIPPPAMRRRSRFHGLGPRMSRRFTTIEGWRDMGGVVYSAAGAGLRIITIDPEFESARYFAHEPLPSRRAKSDGSSSSTMGEEAFPGSAWRTSYGSTIDLMDHYAASVAGSDAASTKEILPSKEFPVAPTTKREEPYHVFSRGQKWLLVAIIGVAGLFSGLSSNIYFPSLDAIAKDLNVSLADVSLTITSYLVAQGITPVIWGSFADTLGRRPIYIASFTVYIIANIGLSFSPNFAVLLSFRALQAAGSASTVSLGNGVIQDISPPSERAGFISFYQAIRSFSIAIGPVLGGALASSLGFRAIFVFLLIISSVVLLAIIVFLPETLRTIAGNGSLKLSGIHRPLIHLVTRPKNQEEPEEPLVRKKVTISTFTDPLKLLAQRDILFNLIFGGVIYTVWSMVTASTTGLFKSVFGLNDLQVGFAFLPNGLGTIVGSAVVGNLMTNDFKDAEVKYKMLYNLPTEYKLPAKNIPVDFPIERTRLRHLPWISVLFTASTALYGFSLSLPNLTTRVGWVAAPLLLQFLIAAASNAVFALNQTIVSDLCPGKGASSSAINNLVRCGLGAVGVALIDGMLGAFGSATTFLGLALIVVACVPIMVVNWYWGTDWRALREQEKIVDQVKR